MAGYVGRVLYHVWTSSLFYHHIQSYPHHSEHGPGSELTLCLRLASFYLHLEEEAVELGCVPLFQNLSNKSNPALKLNEAARSLQLSKAPYGIHTLEMNVMVNVRDSFGIESSILGPGASMQISVVAVPTTLLFRPRSGSDRAMCALNSAEKILKSTDPENANEEAFKGESGNWTRPLTVCVLVSRGRTSFFRAFSSWISAGLMGRASQVLVFLQKWPYNDSMPRNHVEVSQSDKRIRGLALDPNLNVTVIGSPSQLNIAPAMILLFKEASPLSNVLFLEEDFFIDEDIVSNALASKRFEDGLRL